MTKKKRPVMLSSSHPITQAINDMYSVIQPVVWVVNFENGTSLSSKHFPTGFLAISRKDRQKIRAMRFRIENITYSISRKTIDEDNLQVITDGFFYHIKEGRATLMGKYQLHIPFFAERFGFCFNSHGDADVIRIDHSGLVQQISNRIQEIEVAMEQYGFEEVGAHIDLITSKPFTYDATINRFQENIAGTLPGRMIKHPDGKDTGFCYSARGNKIPCWRVNLDLFGDLVILDELGTPPRIIENIREVSSEPHK